MILIKNKLFLILLVIFILILLFFLTKPRCGEDLRVDICAKNQIEIMRAIESFYKRQGYYPKNLEELLKNNLINTSFLHCPLDPMKGISYGYIPPSKNSADFEVVLFCGRHKIKKKPVIIFTQKNGKIRIVYH